VWRYRVLHVGVRLFQERQQGDKRVASGRGVRLIVSDRPCSISIHAEHQAMIVDSDYRLPLWYSHRPTLVPSSDVLSRVGRRIVGVTRRNGALPW
jgi:hypothetical protein